LPGVWQAGVCGVYRLDWIEQLKLKLTAAPAAGTVLAVSPVVWSLGFTSLLTDISTEMVNSALPVYLVLHLHLSPIQYGVIDGLYNGLAVALLSIVAGVVADRWGRHKEVAGFGYVLSAACKLLLLVAGGAWGWIAAVVGLDRVGKGVRSAPRDALISFNTQRHALASAFALHRGLDAGGALLGPVIAFVLLAQIPGAFDVLWLTSFVFAVLGCGVLGLFIPGSRTPAATQARQSGTATTTEEPPPERAAPQPAPSSAMRETFRLLGTRQFGAISICALLLAVSTISDGFVYLVLQERTGTSASFLPLFYVGTACFYMLFSVPAGLLADRFGHRQVLLGGYAVLGVVYVALLSVPDIGWPGAIACLTLMGIYYAGTEGILMALSSAVLPARLRTSGLAMVGTSIGIGKMFSSVLFGWVWVGVGQTTAIVSFIVGLVVVLAIANLWLRGALREQQVVQAP
jgi:MFS family permease